RRADRTSIHITHFQIVDDVVRRAREQNGVVRFEECLDSRPGVADHRNAARRRFEQPHAWREAGTDHVASSDIQRKSLTIVEGAMFRWRKMLNSLDIRRPVDFSWVLRPRDAESSVLPAGGL